MVDRKLGKVRFLSVRQIALIVLALFLMGAGIWAAFFRTPGNASEGSSGALGPNGSGSGGWGGAMWGQRGVGSGFGRPQPVSAGVVRQMDVRLVVNALGTMTALNTATVRAKVDAELKALHFREGSLVKAGQVLADLDSSSLEVQLTQAQGQLERDTAQYKNALVDQQRYKDLLSKDAIAAQQVDTQDALVRQLKGSVLIDQGVLDNARLQLSYTHVIAPISGRVGLKQVEIGSLVRSSDPNGIVTITQFQPIAAVFAVPEKYVPLIQKKLRNGQALPVEVWDGDFARQLGSGKVSLSDNAIDTATGTLKLKALLENKDESLFPNQFTNIRLQLDVLKNVLAVPSSAIQRGALGTFVYVINEDSTVTPQVVKLLALDGDWQGVESDIKPGARVVLDGADRLRAQSKVEVVKTLDANGANVGSSNASSTSVGPSSVSTRGKDATTTSTSSIQPPAGPVGAPSSTKPKEAGASGVGGQQPLQQPLQQQNTAQNAAPVQEGSDEARRQRWMERLPPELVDKVKAMSPDERKAFYQKMRERRQQSQGE